MNKVLIVARPLCVVVFCFGLAACDRDLSISTSELPDATVGVAYSARLAGDHVDRWALFSGVLPPGIQLTDEGVLTGTPRLAGVFSFTIQALRQPTSAPTNSLTQGFAITVR
jgi:hypothetical protein